MCGNTGNKVKKVLYSLLVISVYHDMIKVLFFFTLNFLDIVGKKTNIFKVYLCVSMFILLLFNKQPAPHEIIHKYLWKHKLKNCIFPFVLYFVDFV